MIIKSNIPAMNTLNRLQKNNKNTSSTLERLSSGIRINKAADDAAGFAISEKMRAQIRVLDQATSVRLNGLSGYDGITEIWANKTEASTGGWRLPDAQGDHSDQAKLGDNLADYPDNIQDSHITICFEYMRAVTTTTTVTVPELITIEETIDPKVILQVGANAGDTFEVDLSDVRTDSLGIDQIQVDPREKAVEAIGKIDEAIDKVSSERSKFGAYQTALEHIHNNVSNYAVNLTGAESRIRDADMAKEIIEMSQE